MNYAPDRVEVSVWDSPHFTESGNFRMASLLYRLGSFSARKAWLIVVAWILILGAAAAAALTAGGQFTSSMSINGVPSQVVIAQLKKSFPEASRGSGQVIFQKADGSKLSTDDRAAIEAALEKVLTLEGVSETLNPFAVEAEINSQRAEVADGWAKITDGEQAIIDGKTEIAANKIKLADGMKKLDEAEAKLKTQSAQLEAGIKQAQAAGAPAAQIQGMIAGRAQISGGFAEIKKQRDAIIDGQEKLVAAEVKIVSSSEDLVSGKADLELADQLLKVSKNFSTVSNDGSVALATVQFIKPGAELEEPIKMAVVDSLKAANIPGVNIEFSQDLLRSVEGILGVGEIVGLVIAAVVLFVMLGTFIGAGLPLLLAVIGVGVSGAATFALSSVIEMSSTTPVLGVMLGLAVGIDYALFILNRHRRQLKAGVELRESIALATGTSGNAVLFAGITVIIALAALNLTGIDFVGLMGSMGSLSIAISVAIAITGTPAILSLVGTRILSKKERASIAEGTHFKENAEPKNADKPVWANKHPWIALLAVVAVLGIAAIPASSMRLGLPDGSAEDKGSSAFKAYTITSAAFGPGFNAQIPAVLTLENAVSDDDKLALQANVASQLFELDNVAAVVPAAISADKKTLLFQVVPSVDPSSEETETLVYDIRALGEKFQADQIGELGVTGITATNIDISKKIADVLPLYLGTVLLLSMLLLVLVFRSILIPLIAAGGFLLTIFATFGSVVAVYQWGWLADLFGVNTPGPILSFLPIFLIGILFGLAMDYQLFLVSGMREAYTHGKGTNGSVNYGIRLSRAVVIAAALIMITVFGGFAFSHLTMIRPMGFGLAVGVLADAFLVRLLLVPAAMTIFGKATWWIPKWLDRILPDVDVEGTKLEGKELH
jgi:RND superfamily putative drug exporter